MLQGDGRSIIAAPYQIISLDDLDETQFSDEGGYIQ